MRKEGEEELEAEGEEKGAEEGERRERRRREESEHRKIPIAQLRWLKIKKNKKKPLLLSTPQSNVLRPLSS